MSRYFLQGTLIGILFCMSGQASAIYRCDSGGKVSYSDIPCPGARELDINIPSDTSPHASRLIEEKKILQNAEKARRKEEAAEEKAALRVAKRRAAQDKKCAALERRRDWASQDVSAAPQKTAAKAKRKLDRISELVEAECGRKRTQLLR